MSSRHQAREQALQVLYQMEVSRQPANLALQHFTKNFAFAKGDLEFINTLVMGVTEHLATIDSLIENHAHHWKMPRIAPIDRNILRLGVFELKFGEPVGAAIIIDEAVELAKKFGKDETPGFVNGVLDGIAKAMSSTSGA